MQYFLVQKQQSIKGLVLGGRGDTAFDREAAQKCRHLCVVKEIRVPFAVEKNVTVNPADVRFLGSQTVMTQSHDLANLVE